MPVPKQVIENGAISQSEVRSQNSEGKKSDGSRPMEVVRWKSEEGKKEEGKKEEGKKQLFRIPNAQFCQCPMPSFANAQEHLIYMKKAIQVTQQ
ncbi:hypothetical protein [Microcoleus sp. BROC3]|uniref:hypothetical protein n=1 Tax=Microcoleus sp. BROC3 TaxID=3055323 RepID=UPI002FD4313F